jgi:hypothetical protein
MIVVKLQGGLGNQMFQYALGRALAQKNDDDFALDLTFLLGGMLKENFVMRDYDLDIFAIEPRFTALSRVAQRLPMVRILYRANRGLVKLKSYMGIQRYVPENEYKFHSEILNLKGNIYLDGYWQSEKYFQAAEDLLRSDFRLRAALSEKTRKMAEKIMAVNAVCINVRRGDFVNVPRSMETHGFVGLEYYKRGLDALAARARGLHLFVSSDDMEWSMNNIHFDYPTTYLSHEYKGEKFGEYLYLMAMCQHFVIPNSSFAWWAAWLGQRPGKIVVAPQRWYLGKRKDPDDLVPSSWIRV